MLSFPVVLWPSYSNHGNYYTEKNHFGKISSLAALKECLFDFKLSIGRILFLKLIWKLKLLMSHTGQFKNKWYQCCQSWSDVKIHCYALKNICKRFDTFSSDNGVCLWDQFCVRLCNIRNACYVLHCLLYTYPVTKICQSGYSGIRNQDFIQQEHVLAYETSTILKHDWHL